MADYKTIRGFKIRSVGSDPTVDLGQLWYNTASNTVKYDAVSAGAWATGGSLITGREAPSNAGSSSTATLCFGGNDESTPHTNDLAVNEQYNGTAWTELADMTKARGWAAGAGSVTAAWCAGGQEGTRVKLDNMEEWNGTSWAESNALNTGRAFAASAGTSTAGLVTAGQYTGGPGAGSSLTEAWNGTCWAEVNDLIVATENGRGDGVQTAAYIAGGGNTNDKNEQYNGTSWAEAADLNEGRSSMGASGTTTLGLIFGGSPQQASTEQFNGSSWTEIADLSTARTVLTGSGTAAPNSLAAGGYQADYIYGDWTEEWDGAPAAVKTVTTS